ncbi:LysR family transcriptional regulator [Sandaracinobacter sp. RS1-74]|uniref:LysR family transcriptional regulator n=1 Tax=Sandaracinobacteroides sayramensis TaxID=2913411 RepID=UPI001EDA24A6|nr:LysR family transcriptional regulator [Sandaracinobacteroides sayramensis]MCG2841176.1 LysR family transcriptional regulator [Sandaracinobacteroides sayramensis]
MQPEDWNDYQIFLAVARAGKIARAAIALGIDATTVSRRLRRLEARLEATLFEQTREGQLLTEAGERLLAKVESMARAAADISESGRASGGLSGTLRVSVSEGFGSWFLARHLKEFAHAHPNLTVDLVASSGFLSPSKREADVAVVLSRPKAGPLIARKLSDYALRLYATPAYLAERGAPQQPADLAHGHDLVGYVPDLLYAPELRYLNEICPEPELHPSLRSSSINAQHALIASGAGVGVLPCFIGDADPSLVPALPGQFIVRSFWLVMHKDNYSLARIEGWKEWLLDCVRRNQATLMPQNAL